MSSDEKKTKIVELRPGNLQFPSPNGRAAMSISSGAGEKHFIDAGTAHNFDNLRDCLAELAWSLARFTWLS